MAYTAKPYFQTVKTPPSVVAGYQALKKANPYGLLGPSPARVAKITPKSAPRKLPASSAATGPAPPSIYDQAQSYTDNYIQSILAEIDKQQQDAYAQAQAAAEFERQKGAALAQGLQQLGISGAIQNIFSNAGNNLAGLAQGFSGDLQNQANADAATQARILSGTGQEAAVRNEGQNIGNVVYGLGGQIPGQAFNTSGAAFGAQAALQPGFAQQIAEQNAGQVIQDYIQNVLPQFTQQKQDLITQAPQIFNDYLNNAIDLIKAQNTGTGSSSPTKLTTRTLANGQIQFFNPLTGKAVGKPQGPPKPPPASSTSATKLQARTLADGRVQWFDPTTGQAVGGPQGPKRKTTKKTKGGQTYNLQLKKVAGGQQWFDPRTGTPVGPVLKPPTTSSSAPKKKYTSYQISEFTKTAYNMAKEASLGGTAQDGTTHAPWSKMDNSSITPKQVLQDIIGQGVPFQIAVRQVAKFYKPARKWYNVNKPVNPTIKNASYTSSAQADKIATDAIALGPASGMTYVFGGAGNGGYDCSGYTQAMVAKETGVNLPHNAYQQFHDPRGIPVTKKNLQPGDVVFFKSSPNSGSSAPPWHCGYYIGNGKYVEYYSSGRPARVSSINSRSDFMGARRFGGTSV